jgi:hypothetical protein
MSGANEKIVPADWAPKIIAAKTRKLCSYPLASYLSTVDE